MIKNNQIENDKENERTKSAIEDASIIFSKLKNIIVDEFKITV